MRRSMVPREPGVRNRRHESVFRNELAREETETGRDSGKDFQLLRLALKHKHVPYPQDRRRILRHGSHRRNYERDGSQDAEQRMDERNHVQAWSPSIHLNAEGNSYISSDTLQKQCKGSRKLHKDRQLDPVSGILPRNQMPQQQLRWNERRRSCLQIQGRVNQSMGIEVQQMVVQAEDAFQLLLRQ